MSGAVSGTTSSLFKWRCVRQFAGSCGQFLLAEVDVPRGGFDCAAVLATDLPLVAADRCRSCGLLVSGRLPLWLVARVVCDYRLVPWLAFYVPELGGGLVIGQSGSNAVACGQLVPCGPNGAAASQPAAGHQSYSTPQFRWIRVQGESVTDGWELRLRAPRAGSLFRPADVSRIPEWMHEGIPSNPAVIVLDGPFPVWMLAACVWHLRGQFPHTAIAVYDPKVAGAIVTSPDTQRRFSPGYVLPDPPPAAPPPVVALIGDPNSGKSVLRQKLVAVLRERGHVPWVDADWAAPTPDWSLRSGGPGKQMRQELKQQRRGWQPGDIDHVLETLRHVRRSRIDVVLLDMPGGQHQPGNLSVRIPADRKRLFREIDAFVLLERDASARDGWLKSLRTAGIEDRVRWRVRPVPDPDLARERCLPGPGGAPLWVIAALDRDHSMIITPATRSLARAIHAWCDGRRRADAC